MNLKAMTNKVNDFIKFFQEEKPSVAKDTILFLIQHNFINEKVINTFVVNKMYLAIRDEMPKKEAAIIEMQERYNLGRTYIYSLLKNDSAYFRKNKIYLNSVLIN